MKPHKNLNAWIKSFEFVKEVYVVTQSFPSEERYGLVSQIKRASVSVPVNIAEGAARKSNKEFIQFLHIALGSVTELDTLLLLSFELSFISQEQLNILIEKLDIIGKLIYGLIKSSEKKI